MLAQRLRFSGDIESQAMSSNGYENVGTWSVHAAGVRMGIEPISGKESIAAAVNQAEQVVRIVTRYRADIVPQMRVHALGLYYDIKAVINVGNRNRSLELICSTGRPNGG
jgi:SPP1 family predicted phage head-tail adaptor